MNDDEADRYYRELAADPEMQTVNPRRRIKELEAEVDRLRAEVYLLRQGRGGTPETHVADDRTPLHLTHPIENSQEKPHEDLH